VIKVYIEKISKQILEWSKYNLGELEGRSLNFEDYGIQIHYQDHIQFWYVIMYLIPYKILYIRYSYNTQDICMYTRSIVFRPNPNPNSRNLRNENLNLKNPRKERKSFPKTNHL